MGKIKKMIRKGRMCYSNPSPDLRARERIRKG
jgi:hypothetical protein